MSLPALGTQLFKSYKLSHHTDWYPDGSHLMNIGSMVFNMVPKVYIATDNLQRWTSLLGSQKITVSPFKLACSLSTALAITHTCLFIAGKDRVQFKSHNINLINACVMGVELLADAVSAVAAIGLIAAGSYASGSVILFFLSVQVLDRFHLLPQDSFMLMTCIGHIGGIVFDRSYIVLRVVLLAAIILSQVRWRGKRFLWHDCSKARHVETSSRELEYRVLFLGRSHDKVKLAYQELGRCYLRDEQFEEAKKCLQAACPLEIDSEDFYQKEVLEKGAFEYCVENYSKAERFFSHIEPSKDHILHQDWNAAKGCLYVKTENENDALKFFNTLEPNKLSDRWKREFYIVQGEIFERAENFQEAVTHYRQILEDATYSYEKREFQKKLAYCYYSLNKWTEAERIYQDLIKNSESIYYLWLGRIYRHKKDYETALKMYEKGLDSSLPWKIDYLLFYIGKGFCHKEMQENDKALESAQQAYKLLFKHYSCYSRDDREEAWVALCALRNQLPDAEKFFQQLHSDLVEKQDNKYDIPVEF